MWLIIVVSLVILIIIYYFFIKNKECVIKDDKTAYKPKEFLLSKTEKIVYDAIHSYIQNNALNLKVFPKMRLTDFLWSPKNDRNAYLRINGKFVDFLIVEKPHMNPVAAVFIINDDNKSKMFSLNVISPALKSANIKLINIPSKIVFKQNELNDIIKKNMEEYYEHK